MHQPLTTAAAIDTTTALWESTLFRLTTPPATSTRKAARILGVNRMAVQRWLTEHGYEFAPERGCWQQKKVEKKLPGALDQP